MPENAGLSVSLGQTELDFVEREATPQLLMKLSIQLHLAGLSLSNTVPILGMFGVERVHSTVHNWVHKTDLQPESGRRLDHVAVDETVIQFNDEHYWLYAAVDPKPNELLHTKLEPTTTKAQTIKKVPVQQVFNANGQGRGGRTSEGPQDPHSPQSFAVGKNSLSGPLCP